MRCHQTGPVQESDRNGINIKPAETKAAFATNAKSIMKNGQLLENEGNLS